MVALKPSIADRVAALERRVRDLEDRSDAASHSRDSVLRPNHMREEHKGEIHYNLSSKKKVTISKWRGSSEGPVTLVHIREYYEEKGKQKPSYKGVALTVP